MSDLQDILNNVLYAEYKASINLLVQNGHYSTALVLIFSCIDMLSNLCRPIGSNRAGRSGYIEWINTYFDYPEVDGNHIYSARCAIIHTFGVDSDFTRKGVIPRIGYASGLNQPIIYNEGLTLIDIDSFVKVLYSAFDKFYIDVYSDEKKRSLIEPRLEDELLVQFHKANNYNL